MSTSSASSIENAGLAAPRFGLVATALVYGLTLALSALVTLVVETVAARR